MDSIEKLKDMIASSENIVFFGGAGVSTESGIPDFRSADGYIAAMQLFRRNVFSAIHSSSITPQNSLIFTSQI